MSAEIPEDETLIGWFETDLDNQLHYASGLVVVTNRRILALAPTSPVLPTTHPTPKLNGHPGMWQNWPLTSDLKLHVVEQAAIGMLELCNSTGRLAHWRYTAARSAFARRLEAQWAVLQSRLENSSVGTSVLPTVCPSCGAIITTIDGICTACAPAAPPPPVSSLFRLLTFAKPRAAMAVLGLLLTIVGNFVGLMPAYLTGPLIDNVLSPWHDGRQIVGHSAQFYLVLMFVAAFVAWGLNWGRLFVTSWVSERIAADMRSRTYEHLQSLSLEFFGKKRTGDLMSRIDTDSDRICVFLSVSLVDFVNDMVMIAITSVLLLYKDARLAICTLVPFPIILWLVYVVKLKLRHGFSQSAVAMGQLSSVLADTIPGIRVVKAFAQERREIERFERANQHLLTVNSRLNVIWSFFGPVVSLLTDIGIAGVWCFGVWLIFRTAPGETSTLAVGTLVVFATLMSKFYGRMETMIRIVYSTQRAAASAHRIFEILDRVSSVPEPVKPVHPNRLEGRIELRDVRFKYGTREVLHGLNLQIEPGEMIGLVGPTGAGKSTLINLICRFFDVAEGAVLVDGVDIRSYPVSEYRKHIGIVLQDPFLFYGTIAENIAYGKPGASQAEIIAAARAARAHEFILQLPDGYDSLVGERGQSLSGGERQRISIARALLIDPRILILDEATSAVDTETEREIQIALDNLIRGRTTLAIAHRLSTLRKANRLIVIERGRISEIGKHTELLKEDGTYARLHKAQMELMQGIGV
ncbi:MAG TPA: ABC transporter transmembrane domain-containing protein [Pirellulales bacterium]|nr:ABC transporter transmembrane domain-containing protein [Pirellulales bacterium]